MDKAVELNILKNNFRIAAYIVCWAQKAITSV